METVGMIIRKERGKSGLKVYELAKMVGVHPVYITQIEKHNKLPSLLVYKNIEKSLKLPTNLRTQYFREKDPEMCKQLLPEVIENIVNDSSDDDPLSMIDNYVRSKDLHNLKEARAFVIGLANQLSPNHALSEKSIKELIAMVKNTAKLRSLYQKERGKFIEKIRIITKSKAI